MKEDIDKIINSDHFHWEVYNYIGYCCCPSREEYILGNQRCMEHFRGKFKEGVSVEYSYKKL